ncbi:MAG: putative bifunctional diguanylate cyclase/phosphodiesterase [Allorhizobium sp.]
MEYVPRHLKTHNSVCKSFVVSIAGLFIAVGCMLGALVAYSIGNITVRSDKIDDARAVNAAASAVGAMKKQLEGTIRDNAFWDDAYEQVKSDSRDEWITENWGTTTEAYPLYDTAIVVDAAGKAVMAYENGTPLEGSLSDHFDGGVDALVAAARASDNVSVHFVRNHEGVVLMGAAAIRPSSVDLPFDKENLHILLFAKHLSANLVAEMASDFSLTGLTLEHSPNPNGLNTSLYDVLGKPVGYFAWPRQLPGSKSFVEAKPQLAAAALTLTVFLGGLGFVGFITIRNLKAGEILSRYKATHDALSGLWNRAGLLENLELEREYASRKSTTIQLNLIDLDGFKAVNDSWGHGVGDSLIIAVAERLLDMMPDCAIIARLGGDEFAIVMTETLEELEASDLPRRIQECVGRVFDIDGRTIEIGASVGVAISRGGAIEASELIRQADIALYRAKDSGRGVSIFFEPSFDEENRRITELEGQLRQTLARDEIGIAFQPLVHSDGRGICGVEALARWQPSDGTMIGPDLFIPLAERSGLIDKLGQQIITKAVHAAAQWPGVGLSVNVSPLQLKNPRFVRQVLDILARASFEPSRLTVEITEGVLISNPEQAHRAIKGLKEAGIKIALDDFGCGFASIGTLRAFGFDRMKVDRSLIVALDNEVNAGRVLQATIALANALDIPVTAEGIETNEQAAIVRLSGCDELQGYLFSRPLSAEELTATYFQLQQTNVTVAVS